MPDQDNGDVRIFNVETSFQKLARRPGGVPRDSAVEKAHAKVDELKPGFDDWLDTQINGLVAIVDMAKDRNASSDWIDAANQRSRQLRDVGTTMDFELLTFIADSLCDIFDAIEAGSDLNMESITCHVDALVLVQQKPYRGLKPEQVPELTSGLRRVSEQVSTSPG